MRDTIPCGNLIERDGGSCALPDRDFPDDCHECAAYIHGIHESERTRCECWNRVMGYHRPVEAWNPGKQQEHRDRRLFRESRVEFLRGGDGA